MTDDGWTPPAVCGYRIMCRQGAGRRLLVDGETGPTPLGGHEVMTDALCCDFCEAAVPLGRLKYCSRRHAVRANVLRYRSREGEAYLERDALRKRLARRRQRLLLELNAVPDGGEDYRPDEHWLRLIDEATGFTYRALSPTPARVARAVGVLRKLLVRWPAEAHVSSLAMFADPPLDLQDLLATYGEDPLLERLLKHIQLFHIERHDYLGVAGSLLCQLEFHSALVRDLCDRHFEAVTTLDRDLAVLLEGPLIGARNSDPGTFWAQTFLHHSHRLRRLLLALRRGDIDTVRKCYAALQKLGERDEYCQYETSFWGLRVSEYLGDDVGAERCRAALAKLGWPRPSPTIYRLMREDGATRNLYTLRLSPDLVARAILQPVVPRVSARRSASAKRLP
jgi:hypothetical protein